MTSINYYLGLGDVEKIIADVETKATDVESKSGQKAVVALSILNARELHRAVRAMDDGSARLQKTALAVSIIGIPVGAFLGALFGSVLR